MKLYYKDNGYARVITEDGRDISLLNFCKERAPEGIKPKAFYSKVKTQLTDGLDISEAIDKANSLCVVDNSIYFRGKLYTSLNALCKEFEVSSSSVIYKAKSLSVSYTEALESILAGHFEVRGITFKRVLDAYNYYASEVEVSYAVVGNRVRKGWELEAALFTPPSNDYSFEVDGIIFKSKPEAAKYFNISINTVEARLSNGWSLREALKTPSQSRGTVVKVEDSKGNIKEFPSKSEAIRNLNTSAYESRISDGWLISDLKKHKTLEDFRKNFGVGSEAFSKAFKKTKNVRSAMALAIRHKRANRPSKKKCPSDRANRAFNRPKVKQATPKWLTQTERSSMYELYKLSMRLDGYEIDHIIPLSSPLVCGLHVFSNIRIVRKELNMTKGNSFEVT